MCMFSGRVAHVAATKIFARALRGVQWLAYAMAVEATSDVAMVLPLPVARVADDALAFVDLSRCPKLFDQLDALWPQPQAFELSRSLGPAHGAMPQKLVVHDVGSFEASYVPSLSDMGRLDERFRVPELVWRRRPDYARFGFAVFKLKPGKHAHVHPMAMRFDSAETGALFFPTVHVHDGEVHDVASFDHELYFQVAAGEAVARGDRAPMAVESSVNIDATRGVVARGQPAFRCTLRGSLPNADTRVAITPAPAAVA